MDITGYSLRNRFFYKFLKQLKGNVLEIGFGYGESFQYYNRVDQLYGVELDAQKVEHTYRRILRHQLNNIRLVWIIDEKLPFDDNYFDAVTGSFVMCSVKNPHLLLEEIKRVLKQDGQLIMIEHKLNDNPVNKFFYHKFQVIRKQFTNCKLDLDQISLLQSHGFTITETDSAKFLNQKVIMLKCRIEGQG